MRLIDSSSLCKYINREEGWKEVREELSKGCFTLDLALKEVASSLWKRFKRKELDEGFVLNTYRTFLEYLPVRVWGQREVLEDAFRISLRHDLTIYDSLFIARAIRDEAILITSDRKQARAAELEGLEVLFL